MNVKSIAMGLELGRMEYGVLLVVWSTSYYAYEKYSLRYTSTNLFLDEGYFFSCLSSWRIR